MKASLIPPHLCAVFIFSLQLVRWDPHAKMHAWLLHLLGGMLCGLWWPVCGLWLGL